MDMLRRVFKTVEESLIIKHCYIRVEGMWLLGRVRENYGEIQPSLIRYKYK